MVVWPRVGCHSKRILIGKCSSFMKYLFITLSLYTSKFLGLQARSHFGRYWKMSSDLTASSASILVHLRLKKVTSSRKNKPLLNFFLQSFGKNHLNLKNVVGVDAEVARRYLGFIFFLYIYLFFEHKISNFCSFLQMKWPRNRISLSFIVMFSKGLSKGTVAIAPDSWDWGPSVYIRSQLRCSQGFPFRKKGKESGERKECHPGGSWRFFNFGGKVGDLCVGQRLSLSRVYG